MKRQGVHDDSCVVDGSILFVWPVDFNSRQGDHRELGRGRCVDLSAHKKAIGPQ